MVVPTVQNTDTSTSESVCHTTVNCKKFINFLWVIDNYISVHDKTGIAIKSSTFSGDNDEFDWYLELDPTYDNGRWISLHLHLNKHGDFAEQNPMSGNVSLSLKNGKNEETLTQNSDFLFPSFTFVQPVGFHNFVERSNLVDEANQLLPKDQLTIICKLSYTRCADIINIPSQSVGDFHEERKPAFLEGIEKLFMDDKFSDVTLSVNNQKYPAHKAILAVRCPYFCKMFEDDLKEKKIHAVELKEIDETVFTEVLRYIYTGNAEKFETIVPQLLEAANKYDLIDLKLICEKELLKNLSIENAIDTLVLADEHNAADLKMHAINYIKENPHNPNLLRNEETRKNLITSHPHLLLDLLMALILEKAPL